MIGRLQFSKRAVKDIGRLDKRVADRMRKTLLALVADRPRSNLDVRPLVGRAPWVRLGVGEFRVVLRPLTPQEVASLSIEGPGYLVERVVNRRDLTAVVREL